MDLGSPFALLAVCALVICLLGAARSSSDKNICPCPDIHERNDSLPPTKKCFQIGETFRYTCKGHNLRKAGTSNFIKCKLVGTDTAQWSPSASALTLKCIPDPKITTQQPPHCTVTTDPNRTTTQPPESTVTKGHTDIPHDFSTATTVSESSAAPSSPQTTQSLSPSVSVPAEPDGAQPTSPGLQTPSGRVRGKEDDVTETEATHRTTATTTAAGARDAQVLPPVARTVIGCASVVIFCALIGISFFCYKRRSKKEIPQETEENLALNNVPAEH